jgi:hypothetical protein
MSDPDRGLTDDERRWIASLCRLAAKRPPTLGLWGGTGPLQVIALTEDGALMWPGEVICNIMSIDIPAGGGDPDWVQIEDVERPWVTTSAVGGSGFNDTKEEDR